MLRGLLVFLLSLFPIQDRTFVPPGGVNGEVRTVDGAPAIAVRVVAVPVPSGNGTLDDSLQYFEVAPPTGVAMTDNDGHYIFRDLPPGRYWIMGGVSGQATYYPDSDNLKNAEIIDVQSGFMVEDLDFKLLHRLGGKLSGRVKADMKILGEKTATIIGGKLEDLFEVPVASDGSFQFPHVPPGSYLVSLYPPTPGIASVPVKVANDDVTGLELVPLPTHTVKGRIVSKNGPLPRGILAFVTAKTYVGAKIASDGSFTVQLHSATHQIDMAGLPVGYSLASVKVGAVDATRGIRVQNADVSDVVITVNAPTHLAKVRGTITGIAPERLRLTIVTLTGPAPGVLETLAKPDGTFEFPAVIPGLYTLALPEVTDAKPITVVVDRVDVFNVPVVVPSRQ